jgi:hypothetical protein
MPFVKATGGLKFENRQNSRYVEFDFSSVDPANFQWQLTPDNNFVDAYFVHMKFVSHIDGSDPSTSPDA